MANNKSRKLAIIAIAAVGILVAGSVTAFVTMGASSQPPQQMTAEQITNALLSPSTAGSPALGSTDAPVTIVEFGDYQCTWCYRWHQNTKDQLLADYVNTGKVRFLFKDFPINDLSDRASSMAARASYCAADQGKFWEYHDEVYNNWDGENTGWVTKDSLIHFASNVGLEESEFSGCLDSGRYGDIVRNNYNLAVTVGLDATPSFIILGSDGSEPKLLRGAHPYATFEQEIEKSLSG